MQKLTALEKWSYAIGNMPFAVKDAAFVNFVVFYYTQVHGLSGSLAGLAMFIAMSFDAFTDPLVGSWSDSIKSRWGRRHPLLLAGGVPMAFMFIALFSPPQGMGVTGIFIWLTAVSIVLRTFLTIYFIPYSAMGAELSTDYDERTIIAKARVTMAWLAGMMMPAMAFTFIFRPQDGVDGRLVAANYDLYGLVSAAIAGIAILFCVWGTRTTISRLPQAASDAVKFSVSQTISDFRLALRNRNFRVSLGTHLSFGIAAGVYATLGLYLGTYFWEFSTAQLAGLVVPTAVGTLLTFVFVNWLGQRFEKTTLLCAAALGVAINTFWFAGLRLFDILPDNGHPIIYPLQWLNTVLSIVSIVGLQIVTISLMADILDEQEVETGQRQEGVFFAASSFLQKATIGFGALIAGLVIDVAGISPGSAPGEVAASSLTILGWFMIGIIATLSFIAFLFARNLRLSRTDHAKIRSTLDSRATLAKAQI